ncbi:hypothetical protein D9757_001871 [Collybiopsis confluens]|uniref:Protein transport protein sec16 n=1 Tax=Collybiopsis confluens TaxID=2823264 RepID=A0A8H5HXF0_9AGAR|nr:hypothetical protein D9757_001871 [Collybiopsis confluens]
MSGLEAAASLFGSDDSNSDPFSTLGSESLSSPAPHNPNDDLFAVNDTSSASDFFAAPQSYSEHSTQQGAPLPSQEQPSQWQETSSYGPSPDRHYGDPQSVQNHTEHWQNYSQVNIYGPNYSNDQAPETYNAYTPSAYTISSQPVNPPQSYAPTSTHSQTAYNPYAPPSTYSTAPTQPAYDPYASGQSQKVTTPQSYTSPPVASPQTSYSSYVPQTHSSYGVPSYAPQQNSHAQNAAAVVDSAVPPPAPKAPLNRPKVSNAYDPPFPTTSTRRQTRNATSPPSFNHYASMSPPPPLPQTHSAISSPPPSNPTRSSLSGARPPSVPIPNHYGVTANVAPSNLVQPDRSSITGLPRDSAVAASPYTPTAYSNSYAPSDPIQNHASHNQAHDTSHLSMYDSYAFSSEKSQPAAAQLSGKESLATLQSGTSADFLTGGQSDYHTDFTVSTSATDSQRDAFVSSGLDTRGGTTPLPYGSTSPRKGSPEVSKPLSQSSRITSPTSGGPPKRASSAAAIRSPPRTQSPLSHVNEPSRPRSSNSGLRKSGVNPQHSHSLDLYSPKFGQILEEPASNSLNGVTTSDPYAHLNQTASSPPTRGGASFSQFSSKHDPYASLPSQEPPQAPASSYQSYEPSSIVGSAPKAPPRTRSMSNGSMLSTLSEDPYAPSQHNKLLSNESDYGAYSSRYNYPENEKLSPGIGLSPSTLGFSQEIKAPTHTPYAPSPSLLGTNDPLGRAGARVPVFSFGFGGKFVTCFHGADKMNTGFDVALASRNSTGLEIRTLNKIIPSSALNVSSVSFPGPLFSDPGSPTSGLVRPGAAAQTKTKKTRIIKYLEDRAEELSQGLGYTHSGSEDQAQTESKVILFKLLQTLVENDGKLSGTPSLEATVRAVLIPQTVTDASGIDSSGFTSVADLQGSDSAFPGLSGNANESPIAVTTLRPSALDKIEGFLLRGERRQAYHYALDQKLWSHAMIIASGIDKEAWQEVVNEFLKTELGSHSRTSASSTAASNGREGLRVVYSLLSGQGAKSVHQLVPRTSLSNPASVLLAPMTVAATPMTPNFTVPMTAANIPAESLSKWAEIVAMILSGSLTSETAATLTALGDQLAGNGWTEAAHACYLLSPQTSTVAGLQHPSARIVLLGSRNPQSFSNFISDPDPIILSEIHEFALSLVPIPKGQEPFAGLPHLQVYRFIRAICLAELGDVAAANRYCEAISVSMSRPSPYYSSVMLELLKGLSDRIAGITQTDKTGSWMGSKLAKPSLDGLGGWLEGRFTKLVTGDMESPTLAEHKHNKSEERGFVGPFSHYSTISSTTTSTSPSPQNSVVNLNAYAAAPARTGSAMSSHGPTLDQSRQRYGPPATSANASTATFSQAQARSFGQTLSPDDLLTPRPSDTNEAEDGQELTWWGASNAVTPTASSFVPLSGNALSPATDGFVSLMDNQSYSVASPSNHSYSARVNSGPEDYEEEDLGFGNSKPKPKVEDDSARKTDANKEEQPKVTPNRPDINPIAASSSSSGSWLSRWWKRDSASPGPIKASLGEQNSFYYDAELKKWVNKTGSEAAKPAAPPLPPSRAQTASPAGNGGPPSTRPPSAGTRPPSAGPPPPRAASAMDNSLKPPMRIRSNLVPSDEGGIGSAPSTPTGSRLAPSGQAPGRPRSQASKRNVRSRYVDVFQQEDSSS